MSIAAGLHVALEHHLPARTGIAFRVDAGDHIRVVEDPVGVHDFLSAACDRWRYEELGHKGWHAFCQETSSSR